MFTLRSCDLTGSIVPAASAFFQIFISFVFFNEMSSKIG